MSISQSTVSQHIKQLEDNLGCKLFLRVGKRVHLTDAGKLLLQYCDRIFHEIKNAEMSVRELNTLQRGTIRLGVGATTLIYLMPRILGGYKKSYPEIELVVTTAVTETLLQAVSTQAIDLAIIMRPVAPSQSLRLVPLMHEELVVVLTAAHPLAAREILEARDLEALPFITHLRNTAMQALLKSYFESMTVNPRVVMELENIEAIKGLVRAGLGASILPRCSVIGAHGVGLKALRIRSFPMKRELALALPNSDMLPMAIRRLADRILKGLANRAKS
jgi:LysR family transcriptional activator of glutamate synthase operon